MLTALRVCHGLATALFAPAALATVAELFPDRRGAALGWYTAATQAGALLGPVLGGWLLYRAGFPAAFVTAGLVGSLGLALFTSLRLERPPVPEPGRGVEALLQDLWSGFRGVARNSGVLITSATEGAKMVANGALMAFLPIYGVSAGLNPGEVGLLFGVQGVTSFFSKPVMGRASDRLGRRPLILAGLLLCAGSFATIPHVTGLAPLLALAAAFGFGEAVVATSAAALVADLSEGRTMGVGMGLKGTIVDVGHAAGPLLGGVLIAHLDYRGAFAVIAALHVAPALARRATGRP